jgi:hypothetical protein
VSQVITDTPQDDMERGVANWYFLPVQTPFSEQDLSYIEAPAQLG